ncbi:hypothetical protein N7537_001704 [Penicillium hordei]|uniref:NCT transcriptional regulatory complex subunit A n=1 Tax=Penicillium hordei TaxID=40994 RepID=A0AAD6H8C1_9EURO|nr:uncharacterized protein N7537_001704 [Penicillium hordei]KAJ5616590.1 hypothetical protein N7537_001704 [Penicillium hordei]
MTEDNYRPRSPDLSLPPPPQQHVLASPITSYTSPFLNSYQPYQLPNPSRVSQQYVPPYQPDSDMARRSSRLAQSDHAPIPEPMPEAIQPMPEEIQPMPEAIQPMPEVIQPIPESIAMAPVPAAASEMDEEMPPAPPSAGIEVKTKFPVARIKRIMQADEDVGKVAQVTPIAVSKALELFMISLVTKAAQEAKDRNSKRVTASHLKQAVAKDEVLDFLADIIAKVPDQPASRKHEDDGSDQNEGRRKRGGRRPKDESD